MSRTERLSDCTPGFKVSCGIMQTRKKRLTLDIDPPVQRRLKAVAALKGVSMRRYCLAAIDRELARDEALTGSFNIERLVALQEEAFGDKVLPGDVAEDIREARESRSAHG